MSGRGTHDVKKRHKSAGFLADAVGYFAERFPKLEDKYYGLLERYLVFNKSCPGVTRISQGWRYSPSVAADLRQGKVNLSQRLRLQAEPVPGHAQALQRGRE